MGHGEVVEVHFLLYSNNFGSGFFEVDMKALMGKLAKLIKADKQGSEALSQFIASGDESAVIKLSNGKKYRVSTSKEYKAVI